MGVTPANGRPGGQWYAVMGVFIVLGILVGVFGVAYLSHGDPKAGAALGGISTALLGALYTIFHPNGGGSPPKQP